jgi:hypothetical protein
MQRAASGPASRLVASGDAISNRRFNVASVDDDPRVEIVERHEGEARGGALAVSTAVSVSVFN